MQERAVIWAKWGLIVLAISTLVGFIMLPPALQIPTKWSFDGAPRQFVNAWFGVSIIPVIGAVLYGLMIVFREHLQKRQDKPTAFAAGVGLCIFGLITAQALILWGGLARLG